MTHWTFDAGAESWETTNGFAYNAANLCLMGTVESGGPISTQLTGLSIAVNPGDAISAQFRVVAAGTIGPTDPGDVGGDLEFDGKGQLSLLVNVPSFPFDSGWNYVSGTIASAGTITQISIAVGSNDPVAEYYLDSIYLNEAPAGVPDRRYLGIDADFGNLYLTSITGGSITYYSVPLGGTAADGTATFGTADYADPDTFTHGLYPVVRPGADGFVYLRGRDGNNKQVWYNDLSGGTLGWVDAGPGTAEWGTAKFCVALMPSQLEPEDMIAAFSDNDLYLIQGFTAGSAVHGTAWGKQGDAPTNLRTAARHPTTPESLYLAGTAAGTLNMSVALGAGAFVSIGGTVVTGTINAIEVSR